MPKLALNLLVLNGAKVLPRMFHSLVRGLSNDERWITVDELVVLDTGSDDYTFEVLKEAAKNCCISRFVYERWDPQGDTHFTDTPYDFPTVMEPSGRRLLADWSKARNWLLDNTTADYVLKMDADDELISPAGNLITSCWCLAQNPKISFIDAPYEIMDGDTPAELSMYTRVWRRSPEIRWTQACHEYLTGKRPENTLQTPSGLFVRDCRDSPGAGVRVPYRNLKVLDHYLRANPLCRFDDSKEGILFRYTWATEAISVWPGMAYVNLRTLVDHIDEHDTGFLADLYFQIGRALEGMGAPVATVRNAYEQALNYNPSHFSTIIRLFELLDTDALRKDNSLVLGKLRDRLKTMPQGIRPCGCDLRAWRKLRGET